VSGSPTLPITAAAAATRAGPKHKANEDQYRILDGSHPGIAAQERGCLYAVCDGVSSVPHGREAAQLTCARIDTFFSRYHEPKVESLIAIVSEVDWELRADGKGQAACTLSMLWLAHGMATVIHVGDSQVYRVRHGETIRITRSHRGGRALGAYVGMGPKVADVLQVWQEPVFVGDLFLLVTDGVTEVLDPDDLLDTWWATGASPARAANAIIQAVQAAEAEDDATALVVDVLAVEADADEETTYSGRTDFRK
jgi:protein phosphatase